MHIDRWTYKQVGEHAQHSVSKPSLLAALSKATVQIRCLKQLAQLLPAWKSAAGKQGTRGFQTHAGFRNQTRGHTRWIDTTPTKKKVHTKCIKAATHTVAASDSC